MTESIAHGSDLVPSIGATEANCHDYPYDIF